MTKVKNYIQRQVHEFLDGLYTDSMSVRELQVLEKTLVVGLDHEIDHATVMIDRVLGCVTAAGRLDPVAFSKNFPHYNAQVQLLLRLMGLKSRLVVTQHKLICGQKNKRELELSAFQLSCSFPVVNHQLSTGNFLLPPVDCSSENEIFFYSKLFQHNMDLTDDQWKIVKDLLPPTVKSGAGRPPQSPRRVLDGIFWKIRTTASWDDLLPQYPSHQTCYRYYTIWYRFGVLDKVLRALVKHLSNSGFDLQATLENGEIELICLARKTLIYFGPTWLGTWQASTTLLVMQIIINKKRKQGVAINKIDTSSSRRSLRCFIPIQHRLLFLSVPFLTSLQIPASSDQHFATPWSPHFQFSTRYEVIPF